MISWEKNDLIYLPFWIFMSIAITFVVWFFLRKKDEKTKLIPLQIITSLMLLSELVKQIISICNGYSWYTFPLHFCSLFLYVYPLMVFAKGKIKKFGTIMSYICSWLMTIVYLCSPNMIVGSNAVINMFSSYSAFHTLIYHNFVIMFLLMGLSLNLFRFKPTAGIYVPIGILIYCVVAIPMAHILNVNFCDILQTTFPPLLKIRNAVGDVAYFSLLYVVATLGSMAILYLHIAICTLIEKQKLKKKNDKTEKELA